MKLIVNKSNGILSINAFGLSITCDESEIKETMETLVPLVNIIGPTFLDAEDCEDSNEAIKAMTGGIIKILGLIFLEEGSHNYEIHIQADGNVRIVVNTDVTFNIKDAIVRYKDISDSIYDNTLFYPKEKDEVKEEEK